MTYENANEAKVLSSLWRPGAPLPNTVFAFLDPSGRQLTRGSRGPDRMFGNPQNLAAYMNKVSRAYRERSVQEGLPVVDTVRLGLNVAACDNRPLAVVVGESSQVRNVLKSRLAPTAWSEKMIGKLVYSVGSKDDLRGISGVGLSRGFVFIKPNEFGNQGEVLAQLPATATSKDLTKVAQRVAELNMPDKLSHHQHVRAGRRQGAQWQSVMPITDPHSIQARQRRGRIDSSGRRGPRWQNRHSQSSGYDQGNVNRNRHIYNR